MPCPFQSRVTSVFIPFAKFPKIRGKMVKISQSGIWSRHLTIDGLVPPLEAKTDIVRPVMHDSEDSFPGRWPRASPVPSSNLPVGSSSRSILGCHRGNGEAEQIAPRAALNPSRFSSAAGPTGGLLFGRLARGVSREELTRELPKALLHRWPWGGGCMSLLLPFLPAHMQYRCLSLQ